MTVQNRSRILMAAAAMVAVASVSGCMSSPTYGTDKTATEQLVGDVSGMLSIAPKERPRIDYKPRPELVKPVKGEAENLPAPQDSVASIDNPNWVESPETKRARLRADADENRDDPLWKPEIDQDLGRAQAARNTQSEPLGASKRGLDAGVYARAQQTQSDAFRKKLAESRQGNPTSRKYLSEPPLDYRQTAASAPVGDVGEDEVKKERRLKAAAAKKKEGNWISDLWPL